MSPWLVALAVWASMPGGVLYRLRGGVIKDDLHVGTHIARLVYAVPTAGLVAISLGMDWTGFGIMAVSLFAGLALIGHGAHMVLDYEEWCEGRRQAWRVGLPAPSTTELVTIWLPECFDGKPNLLWPESEVTLYNVIGMGVCGLVRGLITWLPLAALGHPVAAGVLIGLGALNGVIYWLGAKMPAFDEHLRSSSQRGELLIGMTMWAAIVLLAQ